MLGKIKSLIRNSILIGNRVNFLKDKIDSHIRMGESAKINYLCQIYIDKHRDYFNQIADLLSIKAPKFELVRCGQDYDGGYIMADNFSSDMIAYSLGIGDDVSWDKCMAEKGIKVHMYDHTIQGLKCNHENFIFKKIGLGRFSAAGGKIRTLEDLIKENNHVGNNNLLLKMDIENYEYDVIESTPSSIFKQFSQVIIEFHDILLPENISFLPCLKKLSEIFNVVHIHAQNVLPKVRIGDKKVLSNYIEVTFLRKTDCIFEENTLSRPLAIDMPTYKGQREIIIGDF